MNKEKVFTVVSGAMFGLCAWIGVVEVGCFAVNRVVHIVETKKGIFDEVEEIVKNRKR